ncbi:MAG: lecithin retinol acyltransferase family protein [Formivibrio sp.]|nr:lecithin retinol acyltransferase family protein [Formivibrio sp.]
MERGDHLISPRTGYSHHGLYLGRNKVIHYSGFSRGRHKGEIAITNLDEFCQGEGFSIQTYPFRVYSHEESAQRAATRLGEDWYDLLLINSEHFVTWCIQGLHSSPPLNRPLVMTLVRTATVPVPVIRPSYT